MEEQTWVWLVGANFECHNIVERVSRKFSKFLYNLKFIDDESIIKSTILPMSLRSSL